MIDTTLERILDHPSDPPATSPPRAHRLPGESFGSRARWAAPWLAMLVVAGALAPLRDRWFVQAALICWLMFAPGRLLLVVLRVRPMQVRRFPLYTVAMSVLMIMLTGLLVDAIGIALGDAHPLRTGPLWAGTAVGYLLLLALAAAAPPDTRPATRTPADLRSYWVLVLPLLAAAGAGRLNSHHGSTVALVSIFALAAVWLVRPFLPNFSWRTASITVYAAALSGMWAFSLRGDNVYGYDIVTENFVGHRTAAQGIWHLAHYNDAYSALVSLTILPASLHAVAGVAVLTVFKVVFPAVFALVPVGIFNLASRLVGVGWAYVAVGTVIGQTFFFPGLVSLARQEMSLIFFLVMLAALLERRLRTMVPLVVLAAVGTVLSHYSTTYMAGTLTALAFVIGLLRRSTRRSPTVLCSGVAAVVLLGGAYLWYTALTHSSSNIDNLFYALRTSGLDLIPNRQNGVLSTIINGNVYKPMTYQDYSGAIAKQYSAYPDLNLFPGASKYALQAAPARDDGGALASLGGLAVLAVVELINVLSVIGALALAFGRRRRPLQRLIGVLSIGTFGFLAGLRFSHTLALLYTPERAQIQAFLILGPVAVWALWWMRDGLRRRLRHRRPAHARRQTPVVLALAVACTTLLIVNSEGLLRFHPSDDGKASLSSAGEDVDRFVQSAQDLDAARWLNANDPGFQAVYADAYARLRLLAVRGNLDNIAPDVTPLTVGRGAWVYAYSANVLGGTARASFQGRQVIYRFPSAFLHRDLDVVYTNGTAEVFHG